jgi:hypothetical protein
MARVYYWCEYPIDDGARTCMRPAQLTPRGGFRFCEKHAARLPFWPIDEPIGPLPEDQA